MAEYLVQSDSLTAVAEAIRAKTGGTENISFPNGFVSDIGSLYSDQPTLYAPAITTGTNTASWTNNTSNGGFAVTLSADIDGETVTSPLAITEEMDGKTLTVTASATNFKDAVSTQVLTYTPQE